MTLPAPRHDLGSECDMCGWETDSLYDAPEPKYPGNGRPMENTVGGALCVVCYSTHASSVFHWPANYPGQAIVVSQVSWGINYLASLITKQ